MRILVVDDNQTGGMILQQMLASFGTVVTMAATAPNALAVLRKEDQDHAPFGLVLADIRLAEADGLGFDEFVLEATQHSIEIIMMLNSADYGHAAAHYRSLGINTCLIKPIKRSELQAALHGISVGRGMAAGARWPAASENSLQRLPTMNVLLAEDNAVNQKLALRMLEKLGHHVFVVENGREALERAQLDSCDLIFMDVHMPEMDGLAATVAIREWERNRGTHIPIIAMTANAMKGDMEMCLAAGMDAYIAKPVSLHTLRQVMVQVRNGEE